MAKKVLPDESTDEQALADNAELTSAVSREQELTNDLQRVQAEFINFRRRAETERSDAITFAKTRVVREFLAARDSFDAELAHRPASIDPKWAASIDSIRAQFDKAMKNLGVERFESVGHQFDPHRHEAVADAGGNGSHEVVAEELQAGYVLGDTVLRHAMVRVAHTDDISDVKSESKTDDTADDVSATVKEQESNS